MCSARTWHAHVPWPAPLLLGRWGLGCCPAFHGPQLQGLLVWQDFKVNLSKTLAGTQSSSFRNTAWVTPPLPKASVHSERQHAKETHGRDTNTSGPFICCFWSDLELPLACLFPAFHIWSTLPEAHLCPNSREALPACPSPPFGKDLSRHMSLSLGLIL